VLAGWCAGAPAVGGARLGAIARPGWAVGRAGGAAARAPPPALGRRRDLRAVLVAHPL